LGDFHKKLQWRKILGGKMWKHWQPPTHRESVILGAVQCRIGCSAGTCRCWMVLGGRPLSQGVSMTAPFTGVRRGNPRPPPRVWAAPCGRERSRRPAAAPGAGGLGANARTAKSNTTHPHSLSLRTDEASRGPRSRPSPRAGPAPCVPTP